MYGDVVRWTKNRKGSVNKVDNNKLINSPTTSVQVKNMFYNNNKDNSNYGSNKKKCGNNWRNCYAQINLKQISLSNFLTQSFLYKVAFLYIVLNLSNVNTNCAYGDELYEAAGARGHFTNTWAVHIPGGDEVVDRVAREHGYINLGKIFDDYYHFHHNHVTKRSIAAAHEHGQRLRDDERVHWSQQQRAKSRQKRDLIRSRPPKSWNGIQLNDPKWSLMWYLNRGRGLDMNVTPCWKEGITGKGVVVTILDDGLESDHPDLEQNYDPKASYDVNGHDDDPMPHYDMTDSNRHGTRCAGEVAATANNSECAVGIAFGARVGGVRMLDGDVTDAVEARSLSLNPQHIDIYSASWGPDDDGKTVDGPGELATRAFIEGITNGRGGKGSIFIWASGNGGREHDNCNCDGYTNSIWTLSISSATEEGAVPWYSEMCGSTLATTYSSGSQGEKQVVTTDLHHSCTSSHTGTSASAPLAAGIAALVLEANNNLTWRDLQHIVVRTAKPLNLKDPSWSVNGVGRRVSHSFGYGLMDASAMVNLARVWKTVPDQQRCEINAPHLDKQIPPKSHIKLQITVEHCKGVNYLEHVQAKITLTSQRRGDIQIYLTSPSGTRVTLLTSRSHDISRAGFNQWPFMSVHTWGEAPHGSWQLEIHNEGRYMGYATYKGWSLILYGTITAADKNDPIPPRPTTSLNAINNINNYPILSNNNKNNRKQQQQMQQQQQLSQLGLTPAYTNSIPRKNNNNGNNKNKLNTGKNRLANNNNNSNNQRTSTTRPTTNGDANGGGGGGGGGGGNKKYDYGFMLSNGNGNKKNATTRPKQQMQSSSSASGAGNQNNKNNGGGGGGGGIRNDNYFQSYSSIYEKVPIKAPKQVKENGAYSNTNPTTRLSPATTTAIATIYHYDYAEKANNKMPSSIPTTSSSSQPSRTTSSLSSSSSLSSLSTANLRIPKLFQHYDKVEEIFPEFQPPYHMSAKDVGTTKINKQNSFISSSSSASSSSAIGGGGLNVGGGGGKNMPSRANSKIIFFPETDYIASSSIAQKKGSTFVRTQNSHITSGQRNGNAQITQWDLIFYGTEVPSQPDDKPRISKFSFKNSNYGSELDHNSLELDSGTASGQWRDVPQIGESHVDVSATSNDLTGAACLKFTPNNRCIECGQNTYVFDGRCVAACPSESYLVPESVTANPDTNDTEQILSLSLRQAPESEASSPSVELTDYSGLYDIIPQERAVRIKVPQKICQACHSSCGKCSGPAEIDCLECGPNYDAVEVGENKFICQFKIKPSDYLSKRQIYALCFVLALLFTILSVICYVLVKRCWNKKKDYVYDKIRMDEEAENDVIKMKMKKSTTFMPDSGLQQNLNDALDDIGNTSSDSDSE